jgi:iron complex outermembrane receptor protein
MSIFGLSSFSGAINIITGSSDKNETKASITGGDYGYLNAVLGTNQAVGNWVLTGSASYDQSSGYMENTDYKYGNIFLQAQCRDSVSGNWNVQMGGQFKGWGSNSFYSLAYPNQFEATRTLLFSVSWNKRIGDFGFESSIFNRSHIDRFELFRDFTDAPDWYTNHNFHLTNASGVNFKSAWYSPIGKTAAGVELRNENIISNTLGDTLRTPLHVLGQPENIKYSLGKNRLNINYFIEQSFFVNRFSASIGFSGNYNTIFKHNYAFGANVGYEFVRGGSVYASVNRSLRLPTYTDLYYQSATQVANPNLKPEESLNTEVGIKYDAYGLTTSLTVYYRIGKNIIDWIKLPEEVQWHSMNHSRVDAMGGEVSVGYRYGYWLKKAELSYAYCDINKNSGEYMSRYALDYLKHKFNLYLSHGIYRGFGATWNLSFQSRNGNYTDRDNNLRTYDPVWLLDGRLFWQNSKLNIFVEATNILNRSYYDYGGIQQPGIWAKGGIALTI